MLSFSGPTYDFTGKSFILRHADTIDALKKMMAVICHDRRLEQFDENGFALYGSARTQAVTVARLGQTMEGDDGWIIVARADNAAGMKQRIADLVLSSRLYPAPAMDMKLDMAACSSQLVTSASKDSIFFTMPIDDDTVRVWPDFAIDFTIEDEPEKIAVAAKAAYMKCRRHISPTPILPIPPQW